MGLPHCPWTKVVFRADFRLCDTDDDDDDDDDDEDDDDLFS